MEQQHSDFERAVERLGLSLHYVDARGKEVAVSQATLRLLAGALQGDHADVMADAPDITNATALEPETTYQGEDESRRYWLLAVQLYAVRSRRNWGHGDFTDLQYLLELAAQLGAAGIGLNPLHALSHGDASPYSPSSRLFLNPLYVDVEALPEFTSIRSDDLSNRAQVLRGLARTDYVAIAELKDTALRRCFNCYCSSAEDPDFAEFCAERGDSLRKFALFEAARFCAPTAAGHEALQREGRFQEYVQWRADRQLRACRDRGKALGLPIGLYMDLAVGVRVDGADVHAEPTAFLNGISIGAPPDLLNLKGQDWGLTTYHPIALLKQHFDPFRRMLAANMQYAGALRLDHVLWLNRLYLIPRGMQPTDGGYVRYPLSQMLTALAVESNRHCCIVIGEDLGTVPPELRDELQRRGVWTYHVMQFEREDTGEFKAPKGYRPRALATFTTHDLPPFAAWYSASDLAEKREIGLDPGETEEERRRAKELLEVALQQTVPDAGGRFIDVATFLADTPSRLVAVGLEDALGLTEMTNVPGTTVERPNWSQRLPVDLEELGDDARLLRLGEMFASAGRAGAPKI